MNSWTLLIVIYAAVFISSPLIVILHELGHALAYLVFTKPANIDIYIGSYGNRKDAISCRIGKINFLIKKSFPFVKSIGCCVSGTSEENYIYYIIILLAGPFFTFFTAAIFGALVFYGNANLLVQIFCYIFLGFSTLSLIGNLVPREIPTTSGLNLQSDGKQILFSLKAKETLRPFVKARAYLINEEYDIAIAEFEDLPERIRQDEKVTRLVIKAALTAKNYVVAANYIKALENKGELSITDLFNKGCIASFTKDHDNAIILYQQVLKKNKYHLLALNNIAYELVEKQAYVVAQRALDKALKISPDFYHAINTMAYSKILQNEFDEAKKLIDKCIQLNPEQAETYKTLGIYYLKLVDVIKAAENFNKAVELDKNIDIEVYAEQLKQLNEKELVTKSI